MARAKKKEDNGANLGFETKMFLAADKLRGNMDASEYKHVVLGLIFLKYISDAFEAMRAKLQEDEYAKPGGPRGVPRRERLLGASGGPLVPPPGQCQAAVYWQVRGRCHACHRIE